MSYGILTIIMDPAQNVLISPIAYNRLNSGMCWACTVLSLYTNSTDDQTMLTPGLDATIINMIAARRPSLLVFDPHWCK